MRVVRHAVLLLAALSGLGCQRKASPMLPRELEGVWTTDDPRYKDRQLELSQVFVITVTGRQDAPRVEWINRVSTAREGAGLQIAVDATDHSSGTQDHLKLVFSPANGGEIRFNNQPQVWRRQEKGK